MTEQSLYARLGGYDAIVAFTTSLLARLQADDKLARFWQNRGKDGLAREHQLLIDYLVHVTGGHMVYTKFPGPFTETVEQQVMAAVDSLVNGGER